jgi:hypothetical protein
LFPLFATCVNYTGGKFAKGINNTGRKFTVNDTASSTNGKFIACVIDTGGAP